MTAPTVAELEQLAQTYATGTAPWLAFAVHQGDADLIAELLAHLDGIQLRTLAVVLASQIPRPRTRPDDGVVDEVAIARVAAGDDAPLSKAERAAAARLMADQGATQSQISRRLHMSGTSVQQVLNQMEESNAA
ncbi:helix-turn-helix domain-containing protein [Actinomadura alba]|uniref:Helix-turn-helix domain-containing protein n=1 Tax=Actinomadura alba TaxID=406431 RepID=A0ABR7LHF4_9ACTN|nr:helix-turn-helix domain-containing protein [Actinomadura alba]MBC6464281.1 helix-turn-helix domain-containing protein [Actinomadura alba]